MKRRYKYPISSEKLIVLRQFMKKFALRRHYVEKNYFFKFQTLNEES